VLNDCFILTVKPGLGAVQQQPETHVTSINYTLKRKQIPHLRIIPQETHGKMNCAHFSARPH